MPPPGSPDFVWLYDANEAFCDATLSDDGAEETMLSIQHYALKLAQKSNFSTPSEEILKLGGKVLDVGCGQGMWAMEMAIDYPDTIVHGVDTMPIFPSSQVPPNCHFEIMDTRNMTFPQNEFDLVYQRAMMSFYKEDEWPNVIKGLAKVTKPGGWVQLVEKGMKLERMGPTITQVYNHAMKLQVSLGVPIFISQKLAELCADAGLVDIQEYVYSFPMGSWGGTIGTLYGDQNLINIQHLRYYLQPAMGLDDNQWEDMVDTIPREFRKNQTYANMYVIIARKSEE